MSNKILRNCHTIEPIVEGILTQLLAFPQWLTGISGGSSYLITRWIFLRAVGLIYLIAFLSLWVQIHGLIGSNGILPVREYLGGLRQQLGVERYYLVPSVFWLNASDLALHVVCALGVMLATCVIVGFAPALSLIFLWLLYLSFFSVGRDFLSFQWDTLLLETGFLAILFAPWGFDRLSLTQLGFAHETVVAPLALLFLWWLLFRFMFESGIVKLTSGDSTWHDLTALDYHYWTQPLPTWTAWYVAHAPAWFHKSSVLFTYVVEIGFPFLILAGRTGRLVACAGMALLQLMIGLTGNYNFFNLLSITLCLTLLDDKTWLSILPSSLTSYFQFLPPNTYHLPPLPLSWSAVIALFALIAVIVGSWQLYESLFPRTRPPALIGSLLEAIAPFRSLNDYGLFRVMTTSRPEILIEGSNDGKEWKAYEFKWKPGDPGVRPKFVEPHQPRLDWQMWFAALSSFQRTQWFQHFLIRLLEGSPPVLALLRDNPFPGHPPRFVRALLYDYNFTTPLERRETGTWWKRELRESYSPVLSLE